MIPSILESLLPNSLKAAWTDKYVLPTPAGPIQNVTSFLDTVL